MVFGEEGKELGVQVEIDATAFGLLSGLLSLIPQSWQSIVKQNKVFALKIELKHIVSCK